MVSAFCLASVLINFITSQILSVAGENNDKSRKLIRLGSRFYLIQIA